MASPTMYPPKRRRSLAGPFILIFIGVIFLLKNLGWGPDWLHLLGHWWPVLLILILAAQAGITILYFAGTRFRTPADSFVMVWAGIGLTALAKRLPFARALGARI